ncbi:hypothetical protein, partial [uncultured Cohaesibacter sp.]|uniref:hypothetical protein n=1 Tax=uncultured Cohaesibacter sp. TaxID=1002546 RepID=UPI0029C6CCE5
DPLCFFHFTKLGPLGRTMTRRYAQDNYPVYELWRWYEEQVRVNTDPAIPNRYWVYDSFYSGKKLERPIRRLFRDRPDLQSHFADPFDADFEDWVANNYN